MQKYKGNNSCVENTLRNWRKIQRKYEIDKNSIYLREIASDPDFLPKKMDRTLEEWAAKGLQTYSQMITNNTIDTFETLVTRFTTPHNNFFKYLQIRSYLNKKQREEQSCGTHGLLDLISKNRDSKNSKISKLYKILRETKAEVEMGNRNGNNNYKRRLGRLL